ncbi:MAG: urate hydroxylase PuuD [Myxococcaceae bacterium]|nr:urate hydroxylase PuuD [Myxococcaceae bacterium]
MDPTLMQWLDVFLRWVHVVAGVLWVGQLYFFNFVNAHAAKTFDDETRKKVMPQLMTRALYVFRTGAFFTWLTGVLLVGLVFHLGGLLVPFDATPAQKGLAAGVGFGLIFFGFFVYDLFARTPLVRRGPAFMVASLALIGAMAFGLARVMSGRAMFLHVGAVLGSVMMMNVWMRIWPAQRAVLRGLVGKAPAPDAAVPALAALRSKHNAYLSVPVLLFMVSGHTFPLAYGDDLNWAFAVGVVALGYALAWHLFVIFGREKRAEVP